MDSSPTSSNSSSDNTGKTIILTPTSPQDGTVYESLDGIGESLPSTLPTNTQSSPTLPPPNDRSSNPSASSDKISVTFHLRDPAIPLATDSTNVQHTSKLPYAQKIAPPNPPYRTLLAPMAKFRAPFLYTETRLNLDQGYTGSTVDITLPSSSVSTFGYSQEAKRAVISDVQIGSDEATFARDHLASDGSIYFRRDGRYPRSFLWRLLDDRRVLEVQSVDLSQDSTEKTEALLTLLLRFPAAIRPLCIAFGDPDERDALNVFAITTTDELWTLTLHKDFFVHLKATESLTLEWCKVAIPSIFRVARPYRLFASNARELFVSLVDGGIARLTRKAGDDGSYWHDNYFIDGHWASSFTRTIPLWRPRNSVRFGDLDLDSTCAVSIAPSAFDEDDAHLVTVCMNYMLRIWNLKTGKISSEIDILGEDEKEQQGQSRYLIGPTQPQLLQVVDMPGRQEYYAVTYSPKQHRFKFWAIFDPDGGKSGIREMRPEIDFTPPVDSLMDTAVWNLEEFYLRPSRGANQTELWIRVRSGPTSQIFTVKFDPFDFGHKQHEVESQNVRTMWMEDWVSVSHGHQTTEFLDSAIPKEQTDGSSFVEPTSITDKWLDFLFYPGRFTVPTLETALHVYCRASDRPTGSNKTPLKDRLTRAIAANVVVPRSGSSHSDRKREEQFTTEQWQVFYGLVRDLHKRRGDAISFSVDPWDQLPWLVSSDFVSPVRACSDLELCEFNRDIVDLIPDPRQVLYKRPYFEDEEEDDEDDEDDGKAEVGLLLGMAHAFRSSLSSSFQDTLKHAALIEALGEPSSSVMDRFHALQTRTSLSSLQVPVEDVDRFEELVNELGGYTLFQPANFTHVFESLRESEVGRHQQEQITRFGVKTLIRSAQETIILNTETLLDLLVVILFLEGNFEPADLAAIITPASDYTDAMDEDIDGAGGFNAAQLFVDVTKLLREHAVLYFMTSNMRQERAKRQRRSAADSTAMRVSGGEATPEPAYTSTLLESMFIGDWADVKAPEEIAESERITYWCRSWLTSLHVDQYDNFSAHVLADLIKHGDYGLASEFLRFVPATGWSAYLKGRLSLATGDHNAAAASFKKAAFALSLGFFDVNSSDTAELLRPDEHKFFSDGLPSYYEHIMDLLNPAKAHSHIVDFAKMALQTHAQAERRADQDMSESQPLASNEKRRTDLTSRLFTSALHTSRFDEAYSALTRLPATGVRHFSLSSFITTLITQNRVPLLLSYPWTSLANEVDEVLSSLAKKTLNLNVKPEYHKILYSWRVKKGDWRGAAQCAFDRLERLKDQSESARDPNDERLVEAYVLLINTMACVSKDEAWVLKEPAAVTSKAVTTLNGAGKGKQESLDASKRRIVTIEDVRREYQEELDRLAALEQGKFAFAGNGDAMDVL